MAYSAWGSGWQNTSIFSAGVGFTSHLNAARKASGNSTAILVDDRLCVSRDLAGEVEDRSEIGCTGTSVTWLLQHAAISSKKQLGSPLPWYMHGDTCTNEVVRCQACSLCRGAHAGCFSHCSALQDRHVSK